MEIFLANPVISGNALLDATVRHTSVLVRSKLAEQERERERESSD